MEVAIIDRQIVIFTTGEELAIKLIAMGGSIFLLLVAIVFVMHICGTFEQPEEEQTQEHETESKREGALK